MKIGARSQGIGTKEDDTASIEDSVRDAYKELSEETNDTEDTSTDDTGEVATDDGSTDEKSHAESSKEGSADSGDKAHADAKQDGDNADKQDTGRSKRAKKGSGKVAKGADGLAQDTSTEDDEPIELPSSWKAEGKEWFKTQPKEVQKEISRVSGQFDAWRKSQVAEISNKAKEVEAMHSDLRDAIAVADRLIPAWGKQGINTVKAIHDLCKFNEKVIKDPDGALEELARTCKRQITIHGKEGTGTARGKEIDYTTAVATAKQELQTEANNEYFKREHARVSAEAQEVLDSLMSEVTEQGKYVYPDFHDPDFERQLQPLVESIARSNPKLGYKDIILRAYRAAEGRIIPRTGSMTTKLNGNARVAAARKAGSSVPTSTGSTFDDDIEEARPGETAEQTVARMYSHLTSR